MSTKKNNKVLVILLIALVYFVIAGIGWYLASVFDFNKGIIPIITAVIAIVLWVWYDKTQN
ncbi:hypothetical protein QOK74_08020 [Staphylococcus saprophyticus]|uniref:hypothetical protein n=1 Tax=Staphylococcus saprophyticus TaxID=29385 RepID=UPI0024C2EE77|nr:hypothetical protein [Staphylococcus saprophyticus]MDK1672816.1 hypothetical protein [Staphylococcus saprophyticus]